ncbi:MAG TPA: phosphoribosyltransferase [Peptococcaceae bacterium]|nr:phosphoribosyltransferase [Peptococcaceae bacterium]
MLATGKGVSMVVFADRSDAGKRLAEKLLKYKGEHLLVLGIPRGGVIVAAEVAKALKAPLDVVIARKIGAPFNSELAVGAVAPDGSVLYDEKMLSYFGIDKGVFENQIAAEVAEIERRLRLYRGEKEGFNCADKVVILVDDGIATGFTVQAALRFLRKQQPKRLVLAVPVIPRDTAARLNEVVDELVALLIPDVFYAVGQFYRDFRQTTDQEVIAVLTHNNQRNDSE